LFSGGGKGWKAIELSENSTNARRAEGVAAPADDPSVQHHQ